MSVQYNRVAIITPWQALAFYLLGGVHERDADKWTAETQRVYDAAQKAGVVLALPSGTTREETIRDSLDNLGDRLLANDQREHLLNQIVVDAQLMLDVKAWLQECHDWLLTNDLDMRCPMEVDPLDLIDQIDFSFGLAVVRAAQGPSA